MGNSKLTVISLYIQHTKNTTPSREPAIQIPREMQHYWYNWKFIYARSLPNNLPHQSMRVANWHYIDSLSGVLHHYLFVEPLGNVHENSNPQFTRTNKVSYFFFGTRNGMYLIQFPISLQGYSYTDNMCKGRGGGVHAICLCKYQAAAIAVQYECLLKQCACHPVLISCFDPAVHPSFPIGIQTLNMSTELLYTANRCIWNTLYLWFIECLRWTGNFLGTCSLVIN